MKKVIIGLVILLIIGGWMIKSSYNTDFDESEDRKTFFKTFGSWIKSLGGNMLAITSYTVAQNWTPALNESDNG